MKNLLKTVIGMCLVAGLGYAARQGAGSVSKVNDPKPQHFVAGTFTGSEAKDPLSTTINKQAYHLCGVVNYEFPVVTGTHARCAQSSTATITGCGFNDRLTMGTDQTLDRTLVQTIPVVTAANTVAVQLCATGITDGGSYDSPDASFTVCCDGY